MSEEEEEETTLTPKEEPKKTAVPKSVVLTQEIAAELFGDAMKEGTAMGGEPDPVKRHEILNALKEGGYNRIEPDIIEVLEKRAPKLGHFVSEMNMERVVRGFKQQVGKENWEGYVPSQQDVAIQQQAKDAYYQAKKEVDIKDFGVPMSGRYAPIGSHSQLDRYKNHPYVKERIKELFMRLRELKPGEREQFVSSDGYYISRPFEMDDAALDDFEKSGLVPFFEKRWGGSAETDPERAADELVLTDTGQSYDEITEETVPFSSGLFHQFYPNRRFHAAAGLGGELPDASTFEYLYEFGAPLAVEIVPPITFAIVASPLLAGPPGSRVTYFSGLGAVSSASNAWAQDIRVNLGHQEGFEWEQNAAATLLGTVPGFVSTKNMSKAAITLLRAGEGALMASAEEGVRQTLEFTSGRREEFDAKSLLLAFGMGMTLGGGLGRLEYALTNAKPGDSIPRILEQTLRQEVIAAKKAVKATADNPKALAEAEEWLAEAESNLRKINPEEQNILADAIELLEKEQEVIAKAHEDASLELAGKKEIEVEIPEATTTSGVAPLEDIVTSPELQQRVNKALEGVESNATPDSGLKPKPELDALGDEIFGTASGTMQFWRSGVAKVWKNKETGEFYKILDNTGPENARIYNASNPDLLIPTAFREVKDADGNLITTAAIQQPITEMSRLKDVSGTDADLLEKLRLENPLFERGLLENDTGGKNVGLIIEGDRVYAKGFDLDGLTDEAFPPEVLESLEGIKPEGVPLSDFSPEVQRQLRQGQRAGLGAPKVDAAESTLVTGDVEAKAKEVADDFLEGGGARERSPDDAINPDVLSNDPDVQRLINVLQDHLKKELDAGTLSKEEFIANVRERVKKTLGAEEATSIDLLVNGRLTAETAELADAIEGSLLRMGGTAALIDDAFTLLTKRLQDVDVDLADPKVLNDHMLAISRTIPLMMEWKRVGTASGRLLAMRKFVKDVTEVQFEEVEKATEDALLRNLKRADELSPEQLKAQLQTWGELQAIRRILKAVQQADDTAEVKRILMDQQQAFQKSTKAGRALQGHRSPTVVGKIRDVGIDYLYFSMLSAPLTHIKAVIGNVTMQYYHPFLGYIGAKYMATAPWARRGKTKQEFEDAATFHWNVMTNKANRVYGVYNSLAWHEAKKAFKSGDASLDSHFERLGTSALSKENTGLTGELGQVLENAGSFMDIPGRTLSAIDGFAKTRLAHSMAFAKAHHDWTKLSRANEDVGEFDEYYKAYVEKIFKENKIKTEDVVRREAVVAARDLKVPVKDYPEFIDNYVKENWDKSTSQFAEYILRSSKEMAFQEALGEFSDMNQIEKAMKSMETGLRDLSPLGQTILFPFMRTGRNIMREALSHTAVLGDVPVIGKYYNGLWAKTMQDLNSADPIIMARAKGRMVVGSGMIAAIWYLHDEGVIVGKEEQNWKIRENLQIATGLGDYEIRFTDPTSEEGLDIGLSYLNLEPFATVAGMVCDAKKIWEHGTEEEKDEAMLAIQTVMLTVSNNIANKSYYKSMNDVLTAMTEQSENSSAWERKIKGLSSIVIPSGLNAIAMATDDERRRGDEIMQIWAKRLAGIAQNVPGYRDAFGDIVQSHPRDFDRESKWGKVTSWINPIKTTRQRADLNKYYKVDAAGRRSIDVSDVDLNDAKEVRHAAWAILIELDGEFHFADPIKNGVDLRTIRKADGQDAYDRWQQVYSTITLDGLNVKQALVDSLSFSEYSDIKIKKGKLPTGVDLKDPRIKAANRVLSDYRQAAWEQILEEEWGTEGRQILLEILEDTEIRQEHFEYGESEEVEEPGSPLEKFLEKENPPAPYQLPLLKHVPGVGDKAPAGNPELGDE